MVQQRVAAVLGGFDHPPILLASERQPIGAGDPVAKQALHGASDLPGISLCVIVERHLLVRRGLADSGDGALPAVKHGDVLGDRDLVRRLVERLQVGVGGAAVGVA